MMAGPIHLFWTTGSFYLYELSEKYEIRLIVSQAYKKSPQFHQLCDEININVDYLIEGNILLKNFYFSVNLKKIVKDFAPDFLIIHNRFYPESLYLLHWCRLLMPNCFRLSYQDGRMTFGWIHDFQARLDCDVEVLTSKYPYIPKWSAVVIKKIHYRLTYWIHINILPIILIGKVLSPLIDVWSGRIFKSRVGDNFESNKDFLLAYLWSEAVEWEKLCFVKPVCIAHPACVVGFEHFSRLFATKAQTVDILVLPTYGIISNLLQAKDNNELKVIENVTEKWVSALTRILVKYPGRKIGIKLHPGAQIDLLWQTILENILISIPNIYVYSPNEVAERLIVDSEIIVGEVSTCLCWASANAGKTVISLDIFGFKGGGEMKHYEDIHYITALDQIDSIDDSARRIKGEAKGGALTVSNFLATLH
jgi:hypothetical protein